LTLPGHSEHGTPAPDAFAFQQRTVRDMGLCGGLVGDGSWVCIRVAGHDEPCGNPELDHLRTETMMGKRPAGYMSGPLSDLRREVVARIGRVTGAVHDIGVDHEARIKALEGKVAALQKPRKPRTKAVLTDAAKPAEKPAENVKP